eukprot:jgi/Botrbrau1/4107/Bobra.152_3s0055.1
MHALTAWPPCPRSASLSIWACTMCFYVPWAGKPLGLRSVKGLARYRVQNTSLSQLLCDLKVLGAALLCYGVFPIPHLLLDLTLFASPGHVDNESC